MRRDELPDIPGANGYLHEARPVLALSATRSTLFSGIKFFATTGTQDVADGEALTLRLANPEGSGKDFVIVSRSFKSNRQDAEKPITRKLTFDPSPMTGTTPSAGAPMNTRAPLASVAVVEVAQGAPQLATNPNDFGEDMPLNAVPERIDDTANEFVLSPGFSAAYVIFGDGNTSRASATLIWEEVDV